MLRSARNTGLFDAYLESRGRAENTLTRKQVRWQVASQIAMCKLSCQSQAELLSKVRQPGLQEVRPGMLMLHRRWERASLEGCASIPTYDARQAGREKFCDGLWGVVGEKGASEGKIRSDEASGR